MGRLDLPDRWRDEDDDPVAHWKERFTDGDAADACDEIVRAAERVPDRLTRNLSSRAFVSPTSGWLNWHGHRLGRTAKATRQRRDRPWWRYGSVRGAPLPMLPLARLPRPQRDRPWWRYGTLRDT